MENPSSPDPVEDQEPHAARKSLDFNLFVPYRLSLTANMVSRAIAQIYERPHDLTVAEWRLLAVVARQGEASANEICRHTAMDKVRVSRAVGRAVTRGLVERRVDRRDRRRALLSLTPLGRALHDSILPQALAREAELLAGLDDAERRQLLDLLKRLRSRAEALGITDRSGEEGG
jgi:DNA-binding MarR family transcriptional regulator